MPDIRLWLRKKFDADAYQMVSVHTPSEFGGVRPQGVAQYVTSQLGYEYPQTSVVHLYILTTVIV